VTEGNAGRLTARSVNNLRSRGLEIENTAADAPIPIVYGLRPVAGMNAGYGLDSDGKLIVRVVWCCGEVLQIGSVYINGEPLPSGVEVNHYRGTDYQGIDNAMPDIVGIDTYTEDMILIKPFGSMGIAYSVFRFSEGTITDAPRFQALIAGSLVYDTRKVDDYPDPFLPYVAWGMEFVGADNATPADVDYGANNVVATYAGTAKITSNKLALNGSGHVTTPGNVAAVQFGTGTWTVETRFTATSIAAGSRGILTKGGSFILFQDGSTIKLTVSTDGTTNNIFDGFIVRSGVVSGTQYSVTVEFTGEEYLVFSGNTIVGRVSSRAVIFENSATWQFGAIQAASRFIGSIAVARLTKSTFRYGGQCSAASESSAPWRESATAKAGFYYNDLSALCAMDFAVNRFYGMGATQTTPKNQINAIDFNEELINDLARCRISLTIKDVNKSAEWFELLCTYADCFWVREEDAIVLIPDRPVTAENPSGWAMGDNPEYAVDPSDGSWTFGSEWTYDATDKVMVKEATAAPDLPQINLFQSEGKPFEAGVSYVATLRFIGTAGAIRLDLGAEELFPLVSSTGSVIKTTVEFLATGFETGRNLLVRANANFDGVVLEASIRRKYWLENTLVANSLSTSSVPEAGTPTAIKLNYTPILFDDINWPPAVYDAQLPGVSEGLLPIIESAIYMEGVYRFQEAANKALTKMARMVGRVKIGWISTDIGIALRRGLVIQLKDPSSEINELVLVESVQMISYGRYRVQASNYSLAHYPSDAVPVGFGVVPVGAILPAKGNSVPAGWAAWTSANGRFIKGTSTSVGDTGGAASVTPPTINLDAGNSAHTGRESGFRTINVRGVSQRGGAASENFYSETLSTSAGGHPHTTVPDSFTPDVYRTESRMIIKTESISSSIPSEAIVFGATGIIQQGVGRYLQGAKRALKAAGARAIAGINTSALLFKNTSTVAFSHDHWDVEAVTDGKPTALSSTYFAPDQAGPSHLHTAVVLAQTILRQINMPAYWSSTDYKVSPGMIFGWAGSLTLLPANYTLCNGRLGTPDPSTFTIAISAIGEELWTWQAPGIIRYTGQTNDAGLHEHQGAVTTGASLPVASLLHAIPIQHRHFTVTQDQEWEPPYYTLAFIMYNPVPVVGFADVLLQIQGGEADGATVINDVSTYNRTATVSGGSGTLAYTDSQLLFGMTTIATNNHLVAYTGVEYPLAFTLEGFYRIDSVSAGNMVLASNYTAAVTGRFRVRFNDSSDALELIIEDTIVKTGITVTANNWFYFSVSYDGAGWYFHSGMVSTGIATLAGGSAHADAGRAMQNILYVNGADAVGDGNGNFSQLRLTGGAALNKKNTILIPESPFKTA